MSALLLVQSPRASEYQVKAVFLFNFAQFVEWRQSLPRTADARDHRDPREDRRAFLDETCVGASRRASFEIRRYRQLADIDTCNILL